MAAGWFSGPVRWLLGRLGVPVGPGVATAPGGTFRRGRGLGRVFKGYPRTMAILLTTLPKDANETVVYVFDFSLFDEAAAAAGETLSSADVPSVSGLTIGSATVISSATNFVPSGLGAKVTISGGTAGTTYDLECRGTFSGGSIRVVKGRLVVE